MNRIFSLETPKASYTNKAAILWCSDRRFESLRLAFEASIGLMMSDPIIIPGGVKNLVMPKHPRDAEFIMEQIELLRSHGFTRLYAMAHRGCAACHKNMRKAFYVELLFKADEILRARFKDLEILPVFADFDGVYVLEEHCVEGRIRLSA